MGGDGHAIRDAPQIVTVDVLDIPPDVPTLFEGLDRIDPALTALLEQVDVRAVGAFEQDRRRT